MQLVHNEPQSESDLLDQASAWIARLSSDCVGETDMQEFALWLARSDAHKKAYDQIFEVWEDLGVVKHLPLNIPSSPECNHVIEQTPNTLNWSVLLALAASLTLAVIVYPFWTDTTELKFYSTAVGQQKTVHLDDGSIISLNTNTRLEVSLTADQRSIRLHSGEAFFEVAKEAKRPFVVNSCFSEVRALGTAFNIQCSQSKGIVTVTKGLVQVTNTSTTKSAPTLLEMGQSVSVDNTQGISNTENVDSQRSISWRQGQFIFENTPLSEVVYQANRYSSTQIHLGSPQLAQLRVTGRFELTDTQTLLAALKHSLSLESINQDEKSIILNKTAQ